MNNNEEIKETLFQAVNILIPTITGLGILANAFVIAVLMIWERTRANRTIANMFVVNLAIADLLFLVTLPFNIPAVIEINGWIYGGFMCKLISVVKYFNYRASIFFLTAMSVDRYLAIVYALESRGYRTRGNAMKVCIIIGIISLITTIPVMMYASVEDYSGPIQTCREIFPGFNQSRSTHSDLYDYFNLSEDTSLYTDVYNALGEANVSSDYDENYSSASYEYQKVFQEQTAHICKHDGHEHSQSYKAWVYSGLIFYFLAPVLIIMFCYLIIIRTTLKRNITRNKSKEAHYRVAIMVAVLIAMFIVCWLPFQTYELLLIPGNFQVDNPVTCTILEYSFTLLAWSNSAINPILYSISSKRFRDKAKVAWISIRYGHSRVLAMQASQVTMQTRLQTVTSGTSLKSLNVSKP